MNHLPAACLPRRLRSVLLALPLALACSNSAGDGGGASGSGGARAAGGSGGQGTGDAGPNPGGSPGSGLGGATNTGGAPSGGGNSNTGGAPAGGGNSGGTPGAGGNSNTGGAPAGDTGGTSGQGGAAANDGGPMDKSPDLPAPADAGPVSAPSLDACFSGLRSLAAQSQIATKRSADGQIEVRLALEVDGFGTSGTVAWRLVRFGIVTPDAAICVTDENALRTAYKTSHHNCSDVLTVTSGGHTYEFTPPDTDAHRADTTLTIITGGTTGAPVKLSTTSCKTGLPTGICRSGGPC